GNPREKTFARGRGNRPFSKTGGEQIARASRATAWRDLSRNRQRNLRLLATCSIIGLRTRGLPITGGRIVFEIPDTPPFTIIRDNGMTAIGGADITRASSLSLAAGGTGTPAIGILAGATIRMPGTGMTGQSTPVTPVSRPTR